MCILHKKAASSLQGVVGIVTYVVCVPGLTSLLCTLIDYSSLVRSLVMLLLTCIDLPDLLSSSVTTHSEHRAGSIDWRSGNSICYIYMIVRTTYALMPTCYGFN